MGIFIASWVSLWSASLAGPVWISNHRARGVFAIVLAGCAIASLFAFRELQPGWKLLASSLLLLYVMKGCLLLKGGTRRRLNSADLVIFMTLWPGMDAASFHTRRTGDDDDRIASGFERGLASLYLGLAFVLGLAIEAGHLSRLALGWLGIAALLIAVHFGISEILTALLRLGGWPVRALFDHPLQSRTLEDFWTRRWNLAFVEMDRQLFLRPLSRAFGRLGGVLGVFAVSGILHELAISYPAGAGWGGPILYFLIQGAALVIERRRAIPRFLVWIVILGPLPLLFHAAFRNELVVPLFQWLHGVLWLRSWDWYLDKVLWALAVAQLIPLAASFQVPARLKWREELPRLNPFNQKLMWTYGAFVVFTILAFASLTFILHGSFLARERAATWLATFMSAYWVLRLLFDAFYFRIEDWPKGARFGVARSMLNSLFLFLAAGYGATALNGFIG